MVHRVERQSHQFSDGSEIEFTIRTSDSTVFRIFEGDLERRLQSAHRVFADTSLRGFGAFSAGRRDTRQSTTTHPLPDGEVTVSIDASGTGSHEYLNALVRGAVAYTRTLHVEVERASALAILLLGSGLALVAAGLVFPSLPLFGAGGFVALHLVVYWLSARGLAPSLSQIPEPGDRPP